MLSYFVGEKIRKCCAPHDRNRRQDTESKSGNFTVRKLVFTESIFVLSLRLVLPSDLETKEVFRYISWLKMMTDR